MFSRGELAAGMLAVALAAALLPEMFPQQPPELIWACMVGAGVAGLFIAIYVGDRKAKKR